MIDRSVVVLGSSGTGISVALASIRAQAAVVLCETDPFARERAQEFARKDDAVLAQRLFFSAQTSEVQSADFVFDALDASERDSVALQLLEKTVFLTPHARVPKRIHSAMAIRFTPFQPMQMRRLTEISALSATSEPALKHATGFASAIDRVPIILPRDAGSIGLRLGDSLHAAADEMLLHGAVLWELDEAMKEYGFDLGFYEAQDLTGLDVAYARRRLHGTQSKIADRAVEEGRIGKKIGWGWYRYPGGGGAVIDPLIEDLIREEAWFAKLPQREFSFDEIVQKLLFALNTQVRTICQQRLITRPSDLSRILVHGLGFPSTKLSDLDLPNWRD